jgi:hypothetical protein
MTLAELRRRVAVEPQDIRHGRLAVLTQRTVAGRAGGDFRDPAHADGMVLAARKQRGARRRAERRRVEACVIPSRKATKQYLGEESDDEA